MDDYYNYKTTHEYSNGVNTDYYPSSYSKSQPATRMSRFWRTLDVMTSTHFALAVTFVIIAVVQCRDPLLRWYQNLVFRFRYLTLSECLTDIRWTLVDYLRAAWYWAVELTRTRPLQRQEIKQRDLPELVFGSDATTERRDDMPETTPVVVAPPRRKHRRRKPGVLEPAFENNGDYPEGWMVYHALLGVVSKEVADKFEQGKRAETQNNGAVSDNAGDVADDTSSSEKENGVVHGLQRELSNESDGSGDVVEFEEENEAGHRLDAGEDRKPEASEVINGGPAFSEPPQNGTTSFTNSSSNHLCATIS